MKHFISCNSPIRVIGKHGVDYVPCGCCVQCLQAKSDRLTLLLDMESNSSLFVEFLTLTYDDDYIPYVDCNDDIYNINGGTFPIFPIKRVKTPRYKKYIPSKKDYVFVDSKEDLGTASFSCSFYTDIHAYNLRVDEYYKRFPHRNRGIRIHNVLPVLIYSDLQNFLKRFRKLIFKNYETKVRYFAVGEYGTAALRPHWHIVLCHDSTRLHSAFLDTVKLGKLSKGKEQECARFVFDSSVWSFGDCATTTTDKHMSSYISGYLNQHSRFPKVLAGFKQKSFHSTLLGTAKIRPFITELFKNECWKTLTTSFVVGKDNVRRDISTPYSSYSQFLLQFTSMSKYNYATTYKLLSQAIKYVRLFEDSGLSIFDDCTVSHIYRYLQSKSSALPTELRQYLHDVVSPALFNPLKNNYSYHALFSLLYSAKRMYKISAFLGLHPLVYIRKMYAFMDFLSLSRLNDLLRELECDSNFAYQYYSSFDNITGAQSPALLKYKPLYLAQVSDANIAFTENVKHKYVADSYADYTK